MPANNILPQEKARLVRILTLPPSGQTERIPFFANQDLELTFDQSAASFDRSGADLIITTKNWGTLILADFCRPEHAGHLPRFILVSGDIVAGEDLVQVLDPESLPPPSCGPLLEQLVQAEDLCLFGEACGQRAGPGMDHTTIYTESIHPGGLDDAHSIELLLIKHGFIS